MTQLGEYIKMAMKNIVANKGRTLLTMLGIIIGISSVILVMSIGNGATDLIAGELGGIAKGQIGFMLTEYDAKYLLTQEDIEHIRGVDGVKAVLVSDYFDGSMNIRKDEYKVSITAQNVDGFAFNDYTYIQGGQYTEDMAEAGKPVCVISEDDAMSVFGSTNVVGLDLNVTLAYYDQEIAFTIVGVTESEDNDTMIEAMNQTESISITVPPKAIERAIGYSMSDDIYQFYVLKEDDADGKKVVDEIVDYLEVKHHCKGKNIYYYESFDDIMKTVNSVMKLITMFVAFVASISLLVGGIGVMNIMLVSVTERTREIGIRKALGAKTGSITVQFLAESAFITLIGGVIGIILGISGAWIIAKIVHMAMPTIDFVPALKFSTILIATLFSSGVGILFGVYPARKAAKLSPIEALRHN